MNMNSTTTLTMDEGLLNSNSLFWIPIWALLALASTRYALRRLMHLIIDDENDSQNTVTTSASTSPVSSFFTCCPSTPRNLVKSLKGPLNLPILGYLPFISPMPHHKFCQLSSTYGPIFKINLGNMKTLVLNDFRSISLAFKKEEFLGRPENIAFNVLINLQGLGTLSGAAWREQKRFTMQQMKNLGLGKFATEQDIKGNISRVMDRIECAPDGQVCLGQLLSVHDFGITNLLFGSNVTQQLDGSNQLEEAISDAIRSLGQVSLLTFFPQIARLLAHFKLLPFINRLKGNFLLVYTTILSEIERHRRTLDEHSLRDYIDCFLLECKRRRGAEGADVGTFTEQMLAGNVQGFLAAGIETVRTSLHWALLILAKYPDVQQRLYLEVQQTCGRSLTPSWSDRAAMVYTQAVISEIQRWKTISPLNLMRMTTADTTLDGYAVGKGTHVIANLFAVHFDDTYWKNPHDFMPNRFIDSSSGQLIKHQQFIPFSIGKRSCPGEHLAQMEIFLYVTCLVQKYQIKLAKENSLTEVLGLTLQPAEPIHLQFMPRNN